VEQDKPDIDRRKTLRWALLLAPAALLAATVAARAQYYDPCAYGCGVDSARSVARRTARRTSRRH
jgi:hypothetical protein